ncbi:unnamed protein product [Calypogeia fissa]
MLVHGRDPGAFAHFSVTGLWPGDPDFTISSLAKLLRDLESYTGDKTGDLSLTSADSCDPLFSALLDSDAFWKGYLKHRNILVEQFSADPSVTGGDPVYSTSTVTQPPDAQEVGDLLGYWPQVVSRPRDTREADSNFIPLPRHFHLQMDNSAKDNKNQTVIAFCSQLVGQGVFETVTLSFLMVGHTHEDVDALFSRVGQRIHNRELSTFFSLMAEVWECVNIHPIPRLIREARGVHLYFF